MVEKMSSYIVDNMLFKGETIDSDKREVMMFGITRILEDVPKYVLIFLIALFFNSDAEQELQNAGFEK